MTLVEFLLARVDYDEELAECVDPAYHWGRGSLRDRMFAECAAKRKIIRACEMSLTDFYEGGMAEQTLVDLALPYPDHPDFDPVWKLSAL